MGLKNNNLNNMLKISLSGIFLVAFLLIFGVYNISQAGFGISPPTVKAHHLLAGSHFEQTIYLIQGDPEKELKATITIDAPEIEKWISIDKGNNFIIPAGIQQFPIKVQIDVPKKTDLGNYNGIIRVKTMSSDSKNGQISIALGGRIDLDLKVTEEEIFGFIIKSVDIPKLEQGWPVKIIFNIKNTGNIEAGPTKAILEIYDRYESKLLSTNEFTGFDSIKPFEQKALTAEFLTELPVGEYWAYYKLYRDNQLLRQGKDVFNVEPKGSIDKSLFAKIKNWTTDRFIPWFSWMKILYIIIGLTLAYGIYWAKKNLSISKK